MTKKFLAGLLFVCMLACPLYADIVYTTSNGKLGYIKISKSDSDSTLEAEDPVTQYSGFAKDSIAAHYYKDDGTSMIAVIEPETDTRASSGDKAFVFNMSDLTKPLYDEAKILIGVYNTRSVAYSDNHRSVFFASSVNNKPRVSEFHTSELDYMNDYTYTASDDSAVMSSVLVNGGSVYCLINKATKDDSLLLRFDGQLKEGVEGYWKTTADYDAELMTFISDNNIILAHSEGVDRLVNAEFVELLHTDYPVTAICRDKDTGFYFITQADNGEQVLSHYKDNNINELTSGSSQSLITKAVYHNADNKKFAAFIVNDKIVIYSLEDDSLIDEFTSSELGGIPTSITAGRQNTSSSSGSSSNGCSAAGAGIILMLVPIKLMFKKRN